MTAVEFDCKPQIVSGQDQLVFNFSYLVRSGFRTIREDKLYNGNAHPTLSVEEYFIIRPVIPVPSETAQ